MTQYKRTGNRRLKFTTAIYLFLSMYDHLNSQGATRLTIYFTRLSFVLHLISLEMPRWQRQDGPCITCVCIFHWKFYDIHPERRCAFQQMSAQPVPGRSSTPNVEGLPDLADLSDLVIPDVDSCTGNDTVLYTIYWRNCTVAMLSDVFINLEILNTPLILVIMLLQDSNIFKKLTSEIMDSLTGFQDNLVQSWWPDFPTGVTGHVGALQFK